MHTPHVLSGGRYPVLRALAIIYVIGGMLTAVSTILGVGYALFAAGFSFTDRVIIAIGALTAGFFLVLTMFAIAEVLKLFIDLEHNTRMASRARPEMSAAMAPSTMAPAGDANGADAAGTVTSARSHRLDALDEETAEAALLRGH